jgi:hypothetical protein
MQEPGRNSVEFLATKFSFVPIRYNKGENAGRLRLYEMGLRFTKDTLITTLAGSNRLATCCII